MKYIITYFVFHFTQIPCPSQAYFDSIYGGGYHCLVGHGNIEIKKDSAIFYNSDSAYTLFNKKCNDERRNIFVIIDSSYKTKIDSLKL